MGRPVPSLGPGPRPSHYITVVTASTAVHRQSLARQQVTPRHVVLVLALTGTERGARQSVTRSRTGQEAGGEVRSWTGPEVDSLGVEERSGLDRARPVPGQSQYLLVTLLSQALTSTRPGEVGLVPSRPSPSSSSSPSSSNISTSPSSTFLGSVALVI